MKIQDSQERIEKEITLNTINILLKKFDDLLLGMDTKEHKFKTKQEKNRLITSIQNYISYRLKEKIIQNQELWHLLKEITQINLSSKRKSQQFLKILMKLKNTSPFPTSMYLKSPHSKYLRNKAIEESRKANQKKGESVIKDFFKLIK